MTATNQVYLIPQQSNATCCNTTAVEIWANATDLGAGQINLTYDSTCANVTNWIRNTSNFWGGGREYHVGWVWITFWRSAGAEPPQSPSVTGNYMVGTLTIHCVSESECETSLAFMTSGTGNISKLFNGTGAQIPATWKNGTFTCGALSQCLGTCCNDSNCNDQFATNVNCSYCCIGQSKYWKPNKDSACFDGESTSDLCLNYCPHCCDGSDNDIDGNTDFPSDLECTCGLDPSEADPLPPVPELPTILLFSVGLLALTGYVLVRKENKER